MTKNLTKQIEKKLARLRKLLDQVDEARLINPDDSETWDSDLLYDLTENLKKALKLLEDQTSKQLNDWGEPIVLEAGVCSLIDTYQEEKKDD